MTHADLRADPMEPSPSEHCCYAYADAWRAVLALLVPFGALVAGIVELRAHGHAPSDYMTMLSTGELSIWRQGVGWAALAFWVARYFPPAITALAEGPCLVSANDDYILLPGARTVRKSDLVRVRIRRTFLHKVAVLETRQGDARISLIFVRTSSDVRLAQLASPATS